MDGQDTFGTRLQAARLRAGFSSRAALADRLGLEGLAYSDEAIGHWERDRRVPSRDVLLRVFAVLTEGGGFDTIQDINGMLWLLGWRDLNSEEMASHCPALMSAPLPTNLPPRPFNALVGRGDVVGEVVASLSDPVASAVLVISGLGGIGKTAVAWEVVGQLLSMGQFSRIAWVSAKTEVFSGVAALQIGPSFTDLDTILKGFAHQLGYPAFAQLEPDALKMQLREVLHGGGVLLVLDNLETLETIKEVAAELYALVSPGFGSCPSKVLLTSRERLVDEPYVQDVFLKGLAEPEAIALLEREARSRSVGALRQIDPGLGHQIYEVTGGMPLALKLIVSQFLLGIPITAELGRLAGAKDEQELYRFIYFTLWEKLGIDAQKLLVGAATFGASAQRSHLAIVSQLSDARFDEAVAELVKTSLLEVLAFTDPDQLRYDVHPMTRWFVNGPLAEAWQRQREDQSGASLIG